MYDAAVKPSERSTTCPRCGYDQRGAVSTWEDHCPLRGVCTECGLEFEWVDVMSPGRMKPNWCVEHARGWLRVFASVLVTAVHQSLPWLFWRRLAMHHEPRFGRIALYLTLWLATAYLMLMVSQARDALEVYHDQTYVAPSVPTVTPPVLPPTVHVSWRQIYVYPPVPQPETRELRAVAWSVLAPFSTKSPGGYLQSGVSGAMFPAPIEILQRKWVNPYIPYDRYRTLHRLGLLALFWITLLVSTPLSFALLPQTRRKSKVRWEHIARIGLYAAAFSVPMLWWAAIWQVPRYGLPVMGVMCGINWIWWGTACGAYLRLPRPWFVASALTVMMLLFGLAVQYYALHDVFTRHILRYG